ncbi:MAG: hypothetical protein U0169_08650 [Polyangiaceae bacterium]
MASPNRVFFPQASLDEWIVAGVVQFEANEIRLVRENRTYSVVEGVHVTSEVSGSPEATKLVGLVKSKAQLEESGAEILGDSMVLGDNAYEVRPGWIGTPAPSFATFAASAEGGATIARLGIGSASPATDESILALFVAANAG